MPGTFSGPFGDIESSGSSVTLTLDGTVHPTDLLLVFQAWEPLVLTSTWNPIGAVWNKHVTEDDVLLPGDISFFDEGARMELSVGFYEGAMQPQLGRMEGFIAGGVNPPDVGGLPAYPEFSSQQPSGAGSFFMAMQHPSPYDELTFTFASYGPRTTFPVDWCLIKTWRITNFGLMDFPSGVVGANATEGSHMFFVEGEGALVENRYAAAQGDTYNVIYPDFSAGTGTSDGGDTRVYFPDFDGSGLSPVVSHILEIGVAGRWGQGEGTFTWYEWDDPILIDTVERAQTNADAHWEIYYKLLPAQIVTEMGAQGTFGAQTYAQTGVDDTYYRGHVTGTGAMWRGASIRVVAVVPGGGAHVAQRF